MSIFFVCPHCGVKTNVADRYAGQRGPCSKCGAEITIPARSGELRPASQTAADQEGAGPQRPPPRRRSLAASVALLLLIVAGLAVLVLCGLGIGGPIYNGFQRSGRQTACSVHVHRIGQALLSYHQQYQSFPPPYVADAQGKPLHSWRVLILPQLGEDALYAQYDFSQPWDSPHNRQLVGQMPAVFACPAPHQPPLAGTPAPAPGTTDYLAVTGKGFVFEAGRTTSLENIQDGLNQTILFVERRGSGIGWTEPRDLQDGKVEYMAHTPLGVLASEHPGGHVCLADGSPFFVSEATFEEDLRAMFTVAGGE